MHVGLKRAYSPADEADGARFLVDQLWPRGLKKESLPLQGWLKDVAPSTELRKWFHAQGPDAFDKFQRKYVKQLEASRAAWQPLLEAARRGNVTLIFSAKDARHNNAVVLRDFLMARLPAEREREEGGEPEGTTPAGGRRGVSEPKKRGRGSKGATAGKVAEARNKKRPRKG